MLYGSSSLGQGQDQIILSMQQQEEIQNQDKIEHLLLQIQQISCITNFQASPILTLVVFQCLNEKYCPKNW